MKVVNLENLALEFEVPDSVSYTNDGEVENMYRHTRSLRLEDLRILKDRIGKFDCFREYIDGLVKDIRQESWNLSMGKCYCMGKCYTSVIKGPDIEKTNIHIYIRKGLKDDAKARVLGHEETHALIKMNQLELLRELLEKQEVSTIGLSDLPVEVKCHIGGAYSLIRHRGKRFSERALFKFENDIHDELKQAYEWLSSNTNGRFGYRIKG